MSPQLIYNFQQAEPFLPFSMHLVDGSVFEITAPELLTQADDGQSLLLFQPPNIHEYFDPTAIVSLRRKEP